MRKIDEHYLRVVRPEQEPDDTTIWDDMRLIPVALIAAFCGICLTAGWVWCLHWVWVNGIVGLFK